MIQPSLFSHDPRPEISSDQASPVIQPKQFLKPPVASSKPVGMRGSIPDRMAYAGRLSKAETQRDIWRSRGRRMEDENYSNWGDDEYEASPEKHPQTGLPEYGSISTEDVGALHYSGWRSGSQLPVSYHGTAKSAWTKHTKEELVPLDRPLSTSQATVQASRLNEALTQPETKGSPRLPHRELPKIYDDGNGSRHVIDGNHRATSEVLQGALFLHARIARPENVSDMHSQTAKIERAKLDTYENPRRHPDADERIGQMWDGDV